MAKTSLPEIPGKLYALLAPFNAEDRIRAIKATLVLFGDEVPSSPELRTAATETGNNTMTGKELGDAATYLSEKDPKNKGEVLAVAARFREETSNEESHSKADLKKVVMEAHRNFDDSNFGRDINNAKRQAGFFVLGGDRDSHKLSYYGKQYVDLLPDREAASRLTKPRIGSGGRKKRKKSTSKKKAAN